MKCKNDNFIDYFATRNDVFEVSPKSRGEELAQIVGRDVSFYFDNLIMSGIVFAVDEEADIVEVTTFTSKGLEKFDLNREPVNNIVVSNGNYFSIDYNVELRRVEVPLYKYRYTKKELSDLKGKYIKVHYDESYADGLVSEVFFADQAGMILEGEGRIAIKLFQIESLEIVSGDKDYYEIFKENQKITSRVKKIKAPSVVQNNKKYYQKNKIDSYLRDVINYKMGKSVDLSSYEKDWTVEINKQIDDYTLQAFNYFKEYNETITDEEMAVKFQLNDEANFYYQKVYASLKEMIETIENTDWTMFNRTQEEGVIDSLICIYENDMIFN